MKSVEELWEAVERYRVECDSAISDVEKTGDTAHMNHVLTLYLEAYDTWHAALLKCIDQLTK